jgi:hypothetical protein
MHASVSTYRVMDVEPLVQAVQEEVVERVKTIEGFVGYYMIDGGGGTVISITLGDIEEAVEASTAVGATLGGGEGLPPRRGCHRRDRRRGTRARRALTPRRNQRGAGQGQLARAVRMRTSRATLAPISRYTALATARPLAFGSLSPRLSDRRVGASWAPTLIAWNSGSLRLGIAISYLAPPPEMPVLAECSLAEHDDAATHRRVPDFDCLSSGGAVFQ